jgi:hypothetical protein
VTAPRDSAWHCLFGPVMDGSGGVLVSPHAAGGPGGLGGGAGPVGLPFGHPAVPSGSSMGGCPVIREMRGSAEMLGTASSLNSTAFSPSSAAPRGVYMLASPPAAARDGIGGIECELMEVRGRGERRTCICANQ